MLFWVCLILGGGVLLASLLGALEGHPVDHAPLGEAFSWLSLRAVISAVAFFGLAGVLGAWLGVSGGRLLLLASVTGGATGALTGGLVSLARLQEVQPQNASLVGRTALVLVAPLPTRPGKVKLEIAGQVTEMLARSGDELRVGEKVIVIAVTRGQLEVAGWDGR